MILITGGSGYFGSFLLRKLYEQGMNCRIFDLNEVKDKPKEVEFFQGDIRDVRAVQEACKGADVVYHNVAQVPLAKDRSLFKSVNILGTDNLLKVALELGVKKVIYTSSSAVFGVPKSNPVREDAIPSPGETYGLTKYEGEKLCQKYIKKGLDVTILRPRTILGPGRLGIFQILFEWVREGFNIPVLGKGDNIYQFVHVDDLAQACILASERSGASIYNCGTDQYGTMREVLEFLCRHAKTGSRVVSVPLKPALFLMKLTSRLGLSPLGDYHALLYGRSLYFDISKAKKELSWQPRYSNNEMFVQSYEWYLENREFIMNASPSSYHRSPVKEGALKFLRWFIG